MNNLPPLSGSGRLITRINALGIKTEVNGSNVAPNILTNRTTRGTFQRPAKNPAAAGQDVRRIIPVWG